MVALEQMCLVNHKCDILKYCDYGDLQKSIMLGLESKEVSAFLWLDGAAFLNVAGFEFLCMWNW